MTRAELLTRWATHAATTTPTIPPHATRNYIAQQLRDHSRPHVMTSTGRRILADHTDLGAAAAIITAAAQGRSDVTWLDMMGWQAANVTAPAIVAAALLLSDPAMAGWLDVATFPLSHAARALAHVGGAVKQLAGLTVPVFAMAAE